ncbi:MAG: UDP-N-acetylglucosamine--N-acetylmuramyl-(pentapeptide) pyrophosphoryl-undecaprenol N-acetylglucosamine transferase [Chlamydiales bacterium]|nr:UDP-N-acetylglucosamine--N-acetylmuramyl-(pentapeptide) pyrophosphoryl-undecaprenol N-acetylglucosamine transferase [Chlamydiales bacterium]
MSKNKKLLLATGGTGGHLFPAQAIAAEVMKNMPGAEVLFAGAGLKQNRYFEHKEFNYEHVSSMTIFQPNLINIVRCPFLILQGICQSVKLMRSFKPNLVVGFGSFHSAPLVIAAKLCRIPLVLFEPNAYPGRVNRWFSRWARWVAIYFPDAAKQLKARTYLIKMPFWRGVFERAEEVTREQSLSYLGLKGDKKTLLIFGGSQGAASINQWVAEAISELAIDRSELQVIHITGNADVATNLRNSYSRLNIESVVKDFEKNMHLVWPGVDLAVCRAGAGSIAEQINYEVPGVLIPYPHATNNHQLHNGQFMAETVKGAKLLTEQDSDATKLKDILQTLLVSSGGHPGEMKDWLGEMKESIAKYKKISARTSLSSLIMQELEE